MARSLPVRLVLLMVLALAGGNAEALDLESALWVESAVWVEGRVRLPNDVPPDEELRVFALGLARDDARVPGFRDHDRDLFTNPVDRQERGATEVEVGPDGRFRAPFAEQDELGFVWLEANYLYLDAPVEVALPRAAPIRLEPRLGARVTGRFRLPDGFEAIELEPFEVQVLGWSLVGGRGSHRATRRVDSDLRFDFGGLPADLRYFLRADPKALAAFADPSLPVRAGERTERSYVLEVGGRVIGRVVDAEGRPFEGAHVTADFDPAGMFFGGFGGRSGRTGADGRFELSFISGRFSVSASAEGHLEAVSEELDLGEGAWASNLTLRLEPAAEKRTSQR